MFSNNMLLRIHSKGKKMYRKIPHILIYLSLVAPVVLSAGALERYHVPQQKSDPSTQSGTRSVNEEVYARFRDKVNGYSPAKKEKLREQYRNKMKQAIREKNIEAASHYERLIEILNSP